MFPIVFQSGFISVKTLWLFTIVSMLVAIYVALNRLKRQRVDFLLLVKYSSSLIVFSLIFSRFTFFILNTNTYGPSFDLRTLINIFAIWDQGFSFWGAVIGLSGMLTYRLIKAGENLWKWFDALTVPLLVGMAIGNIGQLLGGTSYGTPTNLPWGVSYNIELVKYTVPVHPVQIYSIILIVLILYGKKKIKERSKFFEREGNSGLYFTFSAFLAFFFLEFFRGDDTITLLGIRLESYLFFILILVSGKALYTRFKQFKHPQHEPDQPSQII